MADLNRLYLLDTNIATYLATGRFRSVQDRLWFRCSVLPTSPFSAVTKGELQYGLARKPGAVQLRRTVLKLLQQVSVLPWTSDVAIPYGELRAGVQASGMVLRPLDLMIAGHAYALGATLVTHDAALKRLTAYLAIEDWVDDEQG